MVTGRIEEQVQGDDRATGGQVAWIENDGLFVVVAGETSVEVAENLSGGLFDRPVRAVALEVVDFVEDGTRPCGTR